MCDWDQDLADLQFFAEYNAATRNKYNARKKFNPVVALPEVQFRREFRMSKSSFKKLVLLVSPKIKGAERDPEEVKVQKKPLAKYMKVLIALKFFAADNFHYDTGTGLGYCAATACNVVKEVAPAIASLLPSLLKLPNEGERRRVRTISHCSKR